VRQHGARWPAVSVHDGRQDRRGGKHMIWKTLRRTFGTELFRKRFEEEK
jgi:hypothetical protein